MMKASKLAWYYRGSIFYFFFFILLGISWWSEYDTGNSIIANYYPMLQCPSFLRANAVLELIGTLGFSIGLIAVVYSYWNQRMLGMRYRDLVKYKFHSYHICSIAHVLATGACIMSAAAGTSESALLSLISVIYGFIYQAVVVYWTVWDSSKCSKTAVERYCEIIKHELSTPENENNVELYKYLRKLSDTMPQPADRQYSSQMECLSRTLLAYVIAENRLGTANKSELLPRITDIWTSVLHSPGPYDQPKDCVLFAADLFSYLTSVGFDNEEIKNKYYMSYSELETAWAWNQICSAYIVCRLNELRIGTSEKESHEKLYHEIAKMLTILPQNQLILYIKDALTSVLVSIMLSAFKGHAISYNPQVIYLYKNNKLDTEHEDLWDSRIAFWPSLCNQLQFTITIPPSKSINVIYYVKKI